MEPGSRRRLPSRRARLGTFLTTVAVASLLASGASGEPGHREVPDDPPRPRDPAAQATPRSAAAGGVQVNVDASGANIPGDAANEPSLAVDPANPSRIAVGWRQFDSVSSNFRQAGFGYSTDGGASFRFAGRLTPGEFRSDPVLAAGPDGTFYYYSLRGTPAFDCDLFDSHDAGASWAGPVPAYGGDKAWTAVDRTGGSGNGNVYVAWSTEAGCCADATFMRSVDGGRTFSPPQQVPGLPVFGTLAVAPDGTLYVFGTRPRALSSFSVARTTSARDKAAPVEFELSRAVDMGGAMAFGGPNPDGLLGQGWIAVGPGGQLYVLCSVDPPGPDPLDVMFARSTDRGESWSAPLRVNDDAGDSHQWFGTMSVAPNGRIDVAWNHGGIDAGGRMSELRFTSSDSGGVSFAPSRAVTPAFDHGLGYPNQSKLGDYYHMVSDNAGASIVYAATFNGEQDVYFLRLGPAGGGRRADIDGNGRVDGWDLVLLSLAFGASDGDPRFNPAADLDESGTVDGSDLAILVSQFGS